MNIENFNELIKHNRNLVHTAVAFRESLRAAHAAITMCIDLAEPVAGMHEDEPSEYIIPADNLDEMRQVLIDYKAKNG